MPACETKESPKIKERCKVMAEVPGLHPSPLGDLKEESAVLLFICLFCCFCKKRSVLAIVVFWA